MKCEVLARNKSYLFCFISLFAGICPKSKGCKKLNGKWFFFSKTSKSFSQAVIDCQRKGGKLAEPKDAREKF